MKLHVVDPGEFVPTELNTRDGDGAFSHAQSILVAARQRVKQREPDLLRKSLAHLQYWSAEAGVLAETDASALLAAAADAIATGPDAFCPFPLKTRQWLDRLAARDLPRIEAMKRLLEGASIYSRGELTACDTVLLVQRVDQLIEALRRIGLAARLEDHVEEIGRRTAQFCQLAWPADESIAPESRANAWEAFTTTLQGFARQLLRLLRLGSEAELLLNACRYAAEQIAPRFELSVPQWRLVFSALQEAIAAHAPPRSLAAFIPLIDTLDHASQQLGFAGLVHRNAKGVLAVAEKSGRALPFRASDYLGEMLAEVLWTGARTWSESPNIERLLRGEAVLGGVEPEALEAFHRALINGCRPLAERSYLDPLEEHLGRIAATVRETGRQQSFREGFQKAVRQAAEHLREGRDVFRTYNFLEEDLQFLVDGALLAMVPGRGITEAKRRYSAWFSAMFGLRVSRDIWRSSQTLMKALLTSLRSVCGPFLTDQLVELLEEVPGLLTRADHALRAWSESLDVAGAPCSQAALPLLQRARQQYVLEGLRAGPYRAAALTGEWLATRGVPLDANHAFVFMLGQALAAPASPAVEAVWKELMGESRAQLPAAVARAVQSHALWYESALLGADFVAKLGPDVGPVSEVRVSCQRDMELTFRRAALSLRPLTQDPAGDLTGWWEMLIAPYLGKCPPRMFVRTRSALEELFHERFGPADAAALCGLLLPVYEALAGTGSEPTVASEPRAVRFGGLRASLLDTVVGDAASRLQAMEQDARRYFEAFVAPASPEGAVSAARFAAVLGDGFVPFLWGGMLAPVTTREWEEVSRDAGNGGGPARALLATLMRSVSVSLDLVSALQVLPYLQALHEFDRQAAAGRMLGRQAGNLAHHTAVALERENAARSGRAPSLEVDHPLEGALTGLLEAWAGALALLPSALVPLELCRTIVDSAPLRALGVHGWPRLWRTISQESGLRFQSDGAFELVNSARQFVPAGDFPAALGGTMLAQLEESSDSPRFSVDPKEEAFWFELVRSLAALAAVETLQPAAARSAPVARAAITEALGLDAMLDFHSQLPAVTAALREWFLDQDLNALHDAGARLLGARAQRAQFRELAREADEIGARICQRLPAVATGACREPGTAALTLLTAARGPELGFALPDRSVVWPLPAGLAVGGTEFALSVAALPEPDFQRWSAATVNSLARWDALRGGAAGAMDALRQECLECARFRATWVREWPPEAPPSETKRTFGIFSKRRDEAELRALSLLPEARWMVLRAGWPAGGNGFAAWYREAVLRGTGAALGPKDYADHLFRAAGVAGATAPGAVLQLAALQGDQVRLLAGEKLEQYLFAVARDTGADLAEASRAAFPAFSYEQRLELLASELVSGLARLSDDLTASEPANARAFRDWWPESLLARDQRIRPSQLRSAIEKAVSRMCEKEERAAITALLPS